MPYHTYTIIASVLADEAPSENEVTLSAIRGLEFGLEADVSATAFAGFHLRVGKGADDPRRQAVRFARTLARGGRVRP